MIRTCTPPVAISNKVAATMPDGTTKWLALDGATLYRDNIPASEVYNSALEAQLRERVGVRFAERPSTDRNKRPVREIDGMDERLAERWSSRSAATKLHTAEIGRTFDPPTDRVVSSAAFTRRHHGVSPRRSI